MSLFSLNLGIKQNFDAIESRELKSKLVKCMFTARSVKYLGYIIQENAVLPAQEHLHFTLKLESPTNKTGVYSALGAVNFHFRYTGNSAHQLLRLYRKM